METITSLQNPGVKNVIKLRSASERKKQGLIVIEGCRELKLALQSNYPVKEIYVSSELYTGDVSAEAGGRKVMPVSAEVFRKISMREHPDGILAVAEPKLIDLEHILLSSSPLIIILESVEKPGNIGAVLRSADAAGADAVVLSDPSCDFYNPNVIRASQGTVFTKQAAASTADEIFAWLADNNIELVAATSSAMKSYCEIDYRRPMAVALGTEADGLSEAWIKKARELVKIPMQGAIDSLNVSVAAAVIVFEAVRQRRMNYESGVMNQEL